MSLAWLKPKRPPAPARPAQARRGLLAMAHTAEVIRAEAALRRAGFEVRVMGPPPELQSGCDLVVEFDLDRELDIRRALDQAGLVPLQVAPVLGELMKPVDLCQVKELDGYLLVRAANMKLTVERATRRMVNVSGGGCPDVPYLAARLVGRRLEEAPRPGELGLTLCGYALELAVAEARRRC